MDNNTNNSSPIPHEGGENRSHSSSNIGSPNEDHCCCRPCRHNIRNSKCIPGCSFVHKNEKGFYICEHRCDVTNRSCDSRTRLEKRLYNESFEFDKLQQRCANLLQEYHFLQAAYVECDQAYISQSLLVAQLEQENNYLRQQLDKHSQPKQFAAAFMERTSHQPTRMMRGGHRGGRS